jgi:non-ribosomal peptide synthetase component F
MIDALSRELQRLRGVAVGGEELTPAILNEWHSCGARALRVNAFRCEGKRYYEDGV